MYDEIKYEIDGLSVAITLNRPDALNALTNNMLSDPKCSILRKLADGTV